MEEQLKGGHGVTVYLGCHVTYLVHSRTQWLLLLSTVYVREMSLAPVIGRHFVLQLCVQASLLLGVAGCYHVALLLHAGVSQSVSRAGLLTACLLE